MHGAERRSRLHPLKGGILCQTHSPCLTQGRGSCAMPILRPGAARPPEQQTLHACTALRHSGIMQPPERACMSFHAHCAPRCCIALLPSLRKQCPRPAYLRLPQRPPLPTTQCVSVPPPCRPVLRCSVGQVWICRDGAREPLLGGRLRAWLRCRGVQF